MRAWAEAEGHAAPPGTFKRRPCVWQPGSSGLLLPGPALLFLPAAPCCSFCLPQDSQASARSLARPVPSRSAGHSPTQRVNQGSHHAAAECAQLSTPTPHARSRAPHSRSAGSTQRTNQGGHQLGPNGHTRRAQSTVTDTQARRPHTNVTQRVNQGSQLGAHQLGAHESMNPPDAARVQHAAPQHSRRQSRKALAARALLPLSRSTRRSRAQSPGRPPGPPAGRTPTPTCERVLVSVCPRRPQPPVSKHHTQPNSARQRILCHVTHVVSAWSAGEARAHSESHQSHAM